MTLRSVCRCSSLAACVGLLVLFFAVAQESPLARAADQPAAAPSHQVIACYFHRTVRCPTCMKISDYIEESVNTGFASQLKDGSVKMIMIDFQDPRNGQYTQAYGITGPTLVLLDVQDGKVKFWKPAPRVWSLVGQKDAFLQYVQGEIQSYLQGPRTAAR